MDYKNLIYLCLAIAIILAVLFRDKVKARFFGMSLIAEKTARQNKAHIKGSANELDQVSTSKTMPANNRATISGDNNKIKQS